MASVFIEIEIDTPPSDGDVISYNASAGKWGAAANSGGSGSSDHGTLTGLNDDDHTQYHNDARGDARYYTKSQVDTSLAGKSDVGHTHSFLKSAELDFGSSLVADALFSVSDAAVSTSSKILAFVTWLSSLDRDMDEIAVDPISIAIEPKTGSFDVRAAAVDGAVSGKYGLVYMVA